MPKHTPPPSDDELRSLARGYGMECQRRGQRVTLAEMSRRLGRPSYWLADHRNQTALRCRNIIVSEWIALAAEIPSFLPPSDLREQSDTSPEDLDLGTSYPSGAELYNVLIDPGRLKLFCSLVDSAGLSGAFCWARQEVNFYRANAANRTEEAA